jgi:hypothetical protein
MEESNWGGAYLCWIVEPQKKEEEEEKNICSGGRHGVGKID